jgi:3-deoxy-D-manno-octulosonic-acid transferase
MGRSLGLALYLGFSALADGLARRRLARRQAAGKEDPARLNERFGVAACPRPAGPLAWFHAASVGEALSLIALIRRLTEARPDLSVLVTTGTTSSAAVFADRAPPRTLHHYVPVDTATAVRGFLDHWRPDLAVWTESEFWPRLMHETHRRGIPMLLINARMSETSFRRWRRARGMARSLLRRFDLVLAQEAATEAFLTRLGLPGDRIETIGTLKEGAAPLPCNEAERVRLAAQLGTRPAWLAASTHPGEEEACAAAHGRALPGARRLVLILAPRHPRAGFANRRRSARRRLGGRAAGGGRAADAANPDLCRRHAGRDGAMVPPCAGQLCRRVAGADRRPQPLSSRRRWARPSCTGRMCAISRISTPGSARPGARGWSGPRPRWATRWPS